jgi:hypothetical protein
MDSDRARLKAIWKQRRIPIVLRRQGEGERTRARLPGALTYSVKQQAWLQNGRRIYPRWDWNHSYWEFPKAWFNDFVERCLAAYGTVYIIQPFRTYEICARACMEARGHECNCSCMGQNHGSGVHGSWFEVSDAFAIRSSEPQLACRLLIRKDV